MKFRFSKWLIFVLLVGVSAVELPAQSVSIVDLHKIQRDLNVLEVVLDEMLTVHPARRLRISHNASRSTYIPGLGVIFQVPRSVPGFQYNHFVRRQRRGQEEIVIEHKSSIVVQDTSTRNAVYDFLARYASALESLKAREQVVVVLSQSDWGSQFATGTVMPGTEIIYQTSKDQLQAYRHRKIPAEQFRQAVRVVESASNPDQQAGMMALGNYFESSLKGFNPKSFALRGDVGKLYLDGFGYILLLDAGYVDENSFTMYFFGDGERKKRSRFGKRKRNPHHANVLTRIAYEDSMSQVEAKVAWQQFEDKLVQTMSTADAGLRNLPRDQWLVVAVNLASRFSAVPERAIFRVGAGDLASLQQGRLSVAGFRDRIQIERYNQDQ